MNKENIQKKSGTTHWLFYVIITICIAFFGIAVGQLTVGFLVSMVLMLLSGIYPGLDDGIIEVITHNFCFLMIVGILFIYAQKREKKSVRELWLSGSKHKGRELLFGIAVGFLLCGASMGIALLATDGRLSFQSVDFVVIGLVMISSLIQASAEELLFRGYLLKGLQKRYSVGLSIVLSGIVFAVTHVLNPGLTILAIVNITVFGIVLSYMAVQWNSLYLVTGIHFMWNFTEEIIFGTPNSGIVFSKSVFVMTGGENSLFYNPEFGIESAVQSVIFWCILLVVSRKIAIKKI